MMSGESVSPPEPPDPPVPLPELPLPESPLPLLLLTPIRFLRATQRFAEAVHLVVRVANAQRDAIDAFERYRSIHAGDDASPIL